MNSLSRVAALAVSAGTGSFHSILLFTELLHFNSDQGKCFPSSLWNPLWRPSPYYAQHFQRVHKGSWVRQCCESKFQFFHQLTGVLWLQGGAPFFLCLSRIKKIIMGAPQKSTGQRLIAVWTSWYSTHSNQVPAFQPQWVAVWVYVRTLC